MSVDADVQRVLDWFDAGVLLRPPSDAPNIVALSRAMMSLVGVDGVEMDAPARALADAIGRHDHYVFVLCDGVGMNLVETLPQGAFFRRHLAMDMLTLFPSSTAPVLTSIATGLWPAQHAVPSWWTYLPDARITTTILKYIERYSERPLQEFGITPAQAFPAASLLARASSDVAVVTPRYIAHSTTSGYLYTAAQIIPYDHLRDAIAAIIARVRSARGPTYTHLYVPYVDAGEHERGVYATQVQQTLLHVDRTLAQLARELDGDARIIVTADHGLTDIPAGGQRIITDGDAMLAHLVCPPAGEPRVPVFHVRDGHVDAFAEAFRRDHGEEWALLSIDDAQGLGLFGPRDFSDVARLRFGDFVAVSGSAVEMVHGIKPEGLHGSHGALTPAEMRIPLVLA